MAGESYPKAGILTSQVFALHDAMEPQHVRKLMKRFGDQGAGALELYRAMGRELPVAADTFYGHEDNKFHRTVEVKTTVADQGVGNPTTFVIAAADVDSANRYYARVGEIFQIPGTDQVQARIQSIDDTTTPSAPAITIAPVNDSQNIGALTAGDKLPIVNASYAAGTDQPDAVTTGTVERQFYTQLFKEEAGLDGDQFATDLWYKTYDAEGGIRGWFTLGTAPAELRLHIKFDGAFTFGQEPGTTVQTEPSTSTYGAGNPIYTTKGAFTWARELGGSDAYTEGVFDIEDMRDWGLYLRTQYVMSSEVLTQVGVRLSNDINSAAKDYFVIGSADITQITSQHFGGTAEMAGLLNFKVFNLGDGFNHMLKVNDNWSNPETHGATGQDVDKKGLILPVTSFKNPKTGKMTDNFGSRYRAKDGYSRRMEFWSTRGAGGSPNEYVTSVDRADYHFRAEIGFEGYKFNQSLVIEP